MTRLLTLLLAAPAFAAQSPVDAALDRQDRAALAQLAQAAAARAAQSSSDAAAQYAHALAQSALAQAAMEQADKNAARAAAEAGIPAARRAVELKPDNAEYHRILGTLCGQVIPANVLAGMKYGACARDEVNRAVELAPKSALNYVSRGVGNYYLPPMFGGGLDKAIGDFQKAIQLDAKSDEAYLWLGLALRKQGKNAQARTAMEKSLALNPARAWTKQQLEKTPVQ
ncbi:MAG: tetratricopeptide repeat protein [Bryobacterales bacterium]|nr:tetratricopeptide repeat protein [Bryobacterales bacterium]